MVAYGSRDTGCGMASNRRPVVGSLGRDGNRGHRRGDRHWCLRGAGVRSVRIPGNPVAAGPLRLVLVGFYGWLGLAGGVWSVARYRRIDADFAQVFRLVGDAHMPIMLVAITLQLAAISLRLFGPGLAVATFTTLFWLPALLIGAIRKAYSTGLRQAAVIVAGPYLVWLASVGVTLYIQVGHLL